MKRIREKIWLGRSLLPVVGLGLALAGGRLQSQEVDDLVLPAAAEPLLQVPVPGVAPLEPGIPGGDMTLDPEPAEPGSAEAPDSGLLVSHESSSEGHITLDLVDVEIGEAVKLITRLSGASIISGTTNMNRRVSAMIVDQPWKPSLEMLLEQCDLRLTESREGSGIYVVGPRIPGEREPWATETFQLSYLKSGEAAELLKSLLGAADSRERAGGTRTPAARRGAEDPREEVQVVFREEGRVVSYPAGNLVVVSATADKLSEIRSVLDSIDRPRPQVYIEAKIVELTGDASRQIGLDWSMLEGYEAGVGMLGKTYTKETTRERGSSRYNVGEAGALYDHRGNLMSLESARDQAMDADPARAAALNASTIAQANVGTPYAGVEYASPGGAAVVGNNLMNARFTSVSDVRTAVFGADALRVLLSALLTTDNSAIVSNPKIIVANEEKAMIDMSRKEPYIEVSRRIDGTGVNISETYSTEMKVIPGRNENLSYIEQAFFTYGIKLDVTPRINNPTNITVTIEPTISEVQSYYTPGAGLTRYPVIDTKRVRTVFSLSNGQTAMIGGLTTTSERDIVKKVPLLGSIPLIGPYLFSHSSKQKLQRETIIFVTVRIIDPDQPEVAMSLPEGARLVQGHVTPEGLLLSAEAARVAQEQRLRELEQGMIMEPMGDDQD